MRPTLHTDAVAPVPHEQNDETYAGFLDLVVREMTARGLYAPSPLRTPPRRSHRACANLQRRLLTEAYRVVGPDEVVLFGRGVGHVRGDPLVRVVMSARSPMELFYKWGRLEPYGHSVNRTFLEPIDANSVRVRRQRISGGNPTFVESLYTVGFAGALLELVGAQGVSYSANLIGQPELFWEQGSGRAPPEPTATLPLLWTLSWQGFAPVVHPSVVEPTDHVPELTYNDQTGVVGGLLTLLSRDPVRTWKVEDAAAALSVSPRTLQRRLGDANTTFKLVACRARVSAAVDLMARSDESLTTIAHACGYADAAHLSREVRRVVGPQARELRALLRG